MKPLLLSPATIAAAALLGVIASAFAHDLANGEEHPHYDWSIKPPEFLLAQATLAQSPSRAANRPAQAAPFEMFAPKVKVRWDERFLYVESNGIPAHGMMVGITAWQQQVPLPQNYTGTNAWQFPLVPVPSKTPASIKGRFLRGAIALAVNGIPIFNPQNNRGEISAEIGELDEWGGHCGRADDYHYHAAPLHLQSVAGQGRPIAYALDGYAIYGLTEPDGSAPSGLDAFDGHTTLGLGYHYHASKKYPYVNGGFHGEVVERDGQVDPQPRANPIREALPPLRGAKITAFTATPDEKSYALQYWVNGKTAAVKYATAGDGSWKFQFVNADGATKDETYRSGERPGGAGGARREDARPEGNRPPQPREPRPPQASSNPEPAPLAATKPAGSFALRSSAVADGALLPVEYTGDGPGSTLPLDWSGAPAGTKSYALIMHHLDREGVTKYYWVLTNIPAGTTHLDKNARGIGTLGASFKGQIGYEPPHSQGPGAKTYVLTLYALSGVPPLKAGSPLTGDALSAAMKNLVLASADLSVVYSREGADAAPGAGDRRPPPGAGGPDPSAPPRRESAGVPPPNPSAANSAPNPDSPRRDGGGGKGGPDNKGLIKPTMADTIKVNVYADNWFVMFINGELVAVDSIKFTPHNVVAIDILPEYPMTIAIMAKDNADPKTGLEYGDHIGDGGFIIKFADGTVSNATWKAKNFFKGPIDRDVKNPRVEHTPIPEGWWKTDFDDSKWPNATEFTEQRVNPKQPFYEADFAGAKFIWSDDLDLDNTVIFRTKVDKTGWKKRWNTTPDLDISGAPFK